MMTKPFRGFSDPQPRSTYNVGNSSTAPAALGTKIVRAEPFASITAAALLCEDVSHSGWIRKEGFGIRSWKNRYMILHHGCIYYFKETDSTTPKGKFALNGYSCEFAPEREKADRFPYNFKLVSDDEADRTYYFSSPSKSEMEGWLNHIQDDIKKYCSSQDDDCYDYVDGTNFKPSDPKYPTVPSTMPPRPEPRRPRHSSLPSSPEEACLPFPLRYKDHVGNNLGLISKSPGSPASLRQVPAVPKKQPERENGDVREADPEEMYLDLTALENLPDASETPERNPGSPTSGGRMVPIPPHRPHKRCPPNTPEVHDNLYSQDDAGQEETYLCVLGDNEGEIENDPLRTPPTQSPGGPAVGARKVPVPTRRVPPVCPPSIPCVPDNPCAENGTDPEDLYIAVITNEDDALKCDQPPEYTKPIPKVPKRPPKPKPVLPTVNEEKSLYLPEQCFKPDLNKNDAKVLLGNDRQFGVYVIHGSQTSTTKLVMSVKMSDGVKRYLVFKEKEMYTLDPQTNELFPDLCQLVKYYYTNHLPRCTLYLTAPYR